MTTYYSRTKPIDPNKCCYLYLHLRYVEPIYLPICLAPLCGAKIFEIWKIAKGAISFMENEEIIFFLWIARTEAALDAKKIWSVLDTCIIGDGTVQL